MTSSIYPFQNPASPLTAYVYLLRSAVHGGRFKLGVTNHLAARIDSLHKTYGEFDLDHSTIVAARSRRAAFDLEGMLRVAFHAPSWRVDWNAQLSGSVPSQLCNGATEWYDIKAYEPMIAFVGDMMQRDESCGYNRFELCRGTHWLQPWCYHVLATRKRRRKLDPGLCADAQVLSAENEANFRFVQAWVEERRRQLVEVRPLSTDGEQRWGRALVFADLPQTNFEGNVYNDVDPSNLASSCLVSYCHAQGQGAFSYFGGMTAKEEPPFTYHVELMITTAFERAVANCPALGDLSARIKAWLGQM